MEIDKQRNLHEDQMSDIRTFGSNYQRCSQSRKMSIGIAADLSDNMSNLTGNRRNAKGKKDSPWISPKPLTSKTLSESFNTAKKVANITAVDGAYSNVGSMNEPMAGTVSHSGNIKQKKADIQVPEKEFIKDVISERGKASTQKAVEDITAPNEGVKQHKLMENKSKETLKMKLWETLRTVPLVNKELDGSRSDEVDGNSKMQKDGNKEDAPLKPRVNSDTIETDSEDPELTVSRPVTRSLTRKRGPAVGRPKRLRKKLFPANAEKDVFSFEEYCDRAQYAATGKHLQSEINCTGKKNLDIRTGKTSDPSSRTRNTQQVSSGSKRPSNADEISLRSGIGIAHRYQNQGRKKQAVQREKSFSSPEANDDIQLVGEDKLISPETGGKKGPLNCESAPKFADLINDIFGPPNKMKTNDQLPIPSPRAREPENQNHTRLLAKRIIFVKDAFRFKSTLTAKQINLGSRLRTESSNGPVESDDTTQSMREKHAAEFFTSEKREADKAEEELSVGNVSGEYKETTPEAGHFEKQMPYQSKQADIPPRFSNSEPSSPVFFPNKIPAEGGSEDDADTSPNVGRAEKHISSPKSHDIHETDNYNDLSPAFCSPIATKFIEGSQEYQEDSLERAVASFGCALENFKNKLISSTMKKSSEILESTAQEMHAKFLSAKTQVEKDVTKLTNASRSKRQILEKSFDEQQVQLQLIHDKFKTEIDCHLEEFTRTVESLEAHENELKEVIERRKALHSKLIVQVEEAVEKHLSDAQIRLISIQNVGRSKMQHLKTAIAKCFEDGIFT